MLRRLALPLLLLAGVLPVAACGSNGAGSGPDPATVAPPGTIAYLEATLRPSGEVRDGALAAAGKILGTDDPAAEIRRLLQQAFESEGSKIDYAKDVEPWLGDRAAVWATPPARGSGEPGFAFAIAVRDEDRARSSIEAIARDDGQELRPHGDYELAPDGTAVAVRDDWAIVGSEAEVRRALAALDGDSLADSDKYNKAIEPLANERLAHYYLDTRGFIDAAIEADPQAAGELGPFRSLLSSQFAAPQAGSFSADGDRLVLETFAPAGGGLASKLTSLTGAVAAPLMKELPGDAWGALAVPKTGESLRSVFDQLAGAFGGAAVAGQLRSEYGIDLQDDVFSWIGDTGLFVRGDRPSTVDGALVIAVTDEQRAADAFGKFVGLARTRGGLDPRPVQVDGADAAFAARVPDAPKPLVLARGNGRVVLAYGTDAAARGIASDSKLSDADVYAQARDALGDDLDPALLVSMPAILALADASGSGSDPDYAHAKRYLQAFDAIAMGSERDGDTLRTRFAIGLR